MPVRLPTKALVKTLPRQPQPFIDCFGIWALSIGIMALSVAGLVHLTSHDAAAAAIVLVLASGVIGVALYQTAQSD